MHKTLRSLFLGTLISFGQTAFATPQEDAAYIAERYFDGQLTDIARTSFKQAIAGGYEGELSARSFKIVNTERFLDMIPNSEVAKTVDPEKSSSGGVAYYLLVMFFISTVCRSSVFIYQRVK